MASYQESSPRFLHCAAQVGENCYLWGGHFSGKDQKSPTLSLQTFHPINGMWETKTTTGDAPFGLLDGACTTVSKSLYHFGGNDGNQFYTIRTRTRVRLETIKDFILQPKVAHFEKFAATHIHPVRKYIGASRSKCYMSKNGVTYVKDCEQLWVCPQLKSELNEASM